MAIEKTVKICYNKWNTSTKMRKNQNQWEKWSNGSMAKRQVFFNGPVELVDQEAKKTPEKKAEVDIGQRRIEEFQGLHTQEAQDEVGKLVDLQRAEIQKIINDWNVNAVLGGRSWASAITRGLVDETNKAELDLEITKIAKGQAETEALTYFTPTSEDTREYAESALVILGHKVETSNRLIKNLDTEIADLTKRKGIVEKATKGLLLTRATDWLSQPFSDNLRGRIARLTSMRKTTDQIKKESEASIDVKGKREEKIREWHGGITDLVSPYLEDAKEVNQFQTLLREAVLKGDPESVAVFNAFLDAQGIKTGTERKAIDTLFGNLRNGNTRSFVGPQQGRISDYIGVVSSTDVKNYFRTQMVEIGEVNAGGLEKQVGFLKTQAKPGQEIAIDKQSYVVMRKDGEGLLLREKGTQQVAYLNLKNAKDPALTIQNVVKDGEKPSYEKKILKAAKETNTTAIALAVDTEKKIEKSTGDITPAGKDQRKKTFRESIGGVLQRLGEIVSGKK